MHEEDAVPWEVRLLQAYCNNTDSLEAVCLHEESRVEEGVVRQWVEYYLSRIRTETKWDALNKDQLRAVLEELNSHLSCCIFMVGHKLTLADIVLYYGLHRYLGGMAFVQKAQYPHVCRWFDQVQHFPDIRPFSLPLIVFHKNPEMLTSSVLP